MNCLTFALLYRFLYGGKISILKWGTPWPHFCVRFGDWGVHWKSRHWETWWGQLNYQGDEHWEYLGVIDERT